MQLILASQSPRRKELMKLLHVPFSIQVADIDETMDITKEPRDEVARVGRAKAQAICCDPEDVVVAADTIVVCDGCVLGKPHDRQEAFQMLRLLSGRTHNVMTGLTVLRNGICTSCTEITQVHFRELTDAEIYRYIATGEPMDKAGSYGIQGEAAVFVDWISGDYYNVIGLPVCRLQQMLKQIAPELMEDTQ